MSERSSPQPGEPGEDGSAQGASSDIAPHGPPVAPQLTDEQVAQYLLAHPDFLDRRPDVLARLALRHPHGGKAVSLIERQVEVLREKHRVLERRIATLVRTARDNDTIFDALQSLVRAVLLARDATALPAVVEAALREHFSVPQVALRLWAIDERPLPARWADSPAAQPVEPVVIEQTAALVAPFCGAPEGWRAAALLSEDGADTRSIALVPLRAGAQPRPFGLLALGSADVGRFTSELGIAFLARIGEVVGAALSRSMADQP